MKTIIIMTLIFLVVGIGGLFGYAVLLEGVPASPKHVMAFYMGEDIPEEEEEPEIEFSYVYVEVPALNISVVRDFEVKRMYTALIILEAIDEDAAERIEKMMPRLRHEYLSYLHTLGSLPMVADVADQPFVKRRLQRISDEILGKGVVNSVLLQSAFDRVVNQ